MGNSTGQPVVGEHKPTDAAEEYAALGALPLEPLGDGAYARSVVLAQGGCYAQARTTFEALTGRFPVEMALVYHQVNTLLEEAKKWLQMDSLQRCEEVLLRASQVLEGVAVGNMARAWAPVLEAYIHLWLQRDQPIRALEVATELRSRCGTQTCAPLMAWCLLQIDRPLEAKQWAAQMAPDHKTTPLGRVVARMLLPQEGFTGHGAHGM